MFWLTNFKTAVTSLRQSKWRSMLTMLGIIIGITSVVTIVSLGEGLKHQVNKKINKLGSNVITVRSGKLVNRDSGGDVNSVNLLAFLNTSTLTMKDVDVLNKLPSAESVAPINFVTSSAKTANASSDNLFVIGTSPALADILHQTTNYGDFFEQDQSDTNLAVIGTNVAHQLFGENNPVGQSINIEGQDFIVRGVLKQTSAGILSVAQTDFNSSVFIPSQASLQLTDNRTNILQILVKSKSDNVDNTIGDINQALLKAHDGQQNFTVLKQQELRDIADSTVSTVATFISGIAAISLLVGGISIMDIMWVSVSERTREIGIRKALGATNRQIRGQFLMEGAALSIAGGLIGIVASLAINGLLKLYTNLNPVITLPIMLIAVGVSVVVGIIFSVAPALKAAHKAPIDALRGE